MNGYVARHISVLGPFVPLPLQEGRLSEGAVLRRHWLVPVRQTPRERQVCLAADRGWQDGSDAGPAPTADRGDGLAADGCCGSATKTCGRWLRKMLSTPVWIDMAGDQDLRCRAPFFAGPRRWNCCR